LPTNYKIKAVQICHDGPFDMAKTSWVPALAVENGTVEHGLKERQCALKKFKQDVEPGLKAFFATVVCLCQDLVRLVLQGRNLA
jgi:hypothetical protein